MNEVCMKMIPKTPVMVQKVWEENFAQRDSDADPVAAWSEALGL
jgi:hypothetical protein